MKVLVDDDGKVYAIGDKNVKTARHPEGVKCHIQEYPDDTVFERVNGGFVVSEKQRSDRGWQTARDSQTSRLQRRESALQSKPTTDRERIERIEAILGIDDE